MTEKEFTYQAAGVFKDKHLAKIGFEIARMTKIEEVDEVADGVFVINDEKVGMHYLEPIYRQESDGIGKKEEILAEFNPNIAGRDLVVANVNDLIRWGAQPLTIQIFVEFTNLEDETYRQLMGGAAETCLEVGCMITGGETAQRPKAYSNGQFHLAGFATGVAEKDEIITGQNCRESDYVLGLPSIGLHTNGYSLALEVIEATSASLNYTEQSWGEYDLADLLTKPHKNYYREIKTLIDQGINIHRIVHVTGEGLKRRISERLPKSLDIELIKDSYPIPPVFTHLQRLGHISDEVMDSTFNMGIGMIVDLPKNEFKKAQKILEDIGEESYVIGKITSN